MPRTTATQHGPDPVDLYVGAQVRKRREELGLNQSQLASGLGLTFQQVQKYEKGSNRISASKLHKIAETLRAPVEWFFPATGETLAAPVGSAVEAQAVQRLRRFVSTFPQGDAFLLTTAASGPMLTIALLHTQGRTADELNAELDRIDAGAEA